MRDPTILLGRMQLALDEFRKLHETITAATIVYFLAAAARPGVTGRELAALLDMPKASTSRNYAILADNVTGGLGLLTQKENPHDRREKHIELTARGRRVMQSIIAYLGKD